MVSNTDLVGRPRRQSRRHGIVRLWIVCAALAGSGCRNEPAAESVAAALPPTVESRAEIEIPPEDPPYAPDSVFRPEEHRPLERPLPENVLLATRPFTGERTPAFSHFGAALAIDGARAVVGAPLTDLDAALDAGAVHVVERSAEGWREIAELRAPEPATYDHFGCSVAIAGDLVVVGAEGYDHDGRPETGGAWVFERADGFRRARALVPSRVTAHAAAGWAVAADGDTVAVGAPGDGAGAVHVFERSGGTWAEVATLRGDGVSGHAGFGHALALDRDRLLVGAPMDSGERVLAGAAFVFARTPEGWRLEARLLPEHQDGGERLGRSVALAGDLAVVGAPRARVGSRTRAGAVWAFHRTEAGWSVLAEVVGDPVRSDAEFGRTLGLGASRLVIGSQFLDAVGQATGGAELLAVEDGPSLRRLGPLLAEDPRPMNEFATAVAVGEREVLVGAPRRGPGDDATGFVYTWPIRGESP